MHTFYTLAQSGHGSTNWVRLIGFLIVVGFSVLSWVLRKLQEQAAKRKVQEQIERRELELLRTGRATTEAPQAQAAASGPPSQSEVDRRIEELRRRREAMARRRVEEGGRTATPPISPTPPAPPQDRPMVFAGTSGPFVPPRPRPVVLVPPPVPQQARTTPSRPRRDARPDEAQRAKPTARASGRGNLASTLEKRDAARADQIAQTAPPAPAPAPRSADAVPRSAAEWRRALISREVLAPPLGLRSSGDTPPGLLS
jgi:hypothetical protein